MNFKMKLLDAKTINAFLARAWRNWNPLYVQMVKRDFSRTQILQMRYIPLRIKSYLGRNTVRKHIIRICKECFRSKSNQSDSTKVLPFIWFSFWWARTSFTTNSCIFNLKSHCFVRGKTDICGKRLIRK